MNIVHAAKSVLMQLGLLVSLVLVAGCGESNDQAYTNAAGSAPKSSERTKVVLPLPEASRLEPSEELVERVKERWEASSSRKLPDGPDAPMQQTYLRQRRQWLEQLYSRSLEKNAPADAAWREQAATVVAHWVDFVSGKKTAKQPQDIAPLARAVIDGGCNDPLVRLVYGRTLAATDSLEARRLAAEQISQAAKELDSSGYPRFLIYLAHVVYVETNPQADASNLQRHRHAAVRAAVDALSEELPEGAHRGVHDQLKAHLEGPLAPVAGEMMAALAAAPKADPWVYRMLAAEQHIQMGWGVRGKGLADTVAPQAWAELDERLRAARVLLLEAWQLRPEYPHAAARMILIEKHLGGVAGEDARFWFDEAVQSEFDYKPAYLQRLWGLQLRWGGSVRELLDFGRECVETGRFDTDVPWMFHEAVAAARSDMGESSALFQWDEVYETLRTLFNGYAQAATDERSKNYYRSLLMGAAWLGQRMDDVRQLSDEIGLGLDPKALSYHLQVDAAEVRAALEAVAADDGKFAGSRPSVSGLVLSPNGETLWVSTVKGEITQWSVAEGKQLSTLEGHRSTAAGIAGSPDGAWLVTADREGMARLTSARDPHEVHTLPHDGPLITAVFSRDSKRLATASYSARLCEIRVWDCETCELIATIEPAYRMVVGLALSSDGKQLVAACIPLDFNFSCHTADVTIYDVASAAPAAQVAGAAVKPTAVAFSADGRHLAVAGQELRTTTQGAMLWPTLQLFNTADYSLVGDLKGHRKEIHRVQFVHDDRHVMSCSRDGTIRFWETAEREPLSVLHGHSGAVTAVAASETLLITGDVYGHILEWDITPQNLQSQVQSNITRFIFRDGVKELRTLPNEDGLAVTSFAYGMSRWRAADKFLKAHGHPTPADQIVSDADLSPDGRTIGVVLTGQSASTVLLEADTGRIITRLSRHDGLTRSLRFSPDGGTIACGTARGQVVLYDARNPKAWPWGIAVEHAGQPGRLAFSADGRRLASGDERGMVKIWSLPADPESRQQQLTSERTMQMPSIIHCLAFSPDGNRLAAGSGDTQVWDVQSGSKLLQLSGQEASFSPDGMLLVTGGGNLKSEAAVWDAASGERRLDLKGAHHADITCVLFANSQRVVTGDLHGKLRCWNAQTGEQVTPFSGLERPSE